MYSQKCCYFYNQISQAIEFLQSKIKHRKAVLLSCLEQEDLLFKEQLLECQIDVVEIFLDKQALIKTDRVCHLFNVNEDVRAVITFSESLIDVAKYLSSIMNVPCFIFCSISNRVFFDCLLIENDSKIDKYFISNQIFLMVDENMVNKNDVACDLSTACLSLLDYISMNTLISRSELNEYANLKRHLTRAIIDFKNEKYVLAKKNLINFYMEFVNDDKLIPTHVLLSMFLEQPLTASEQLYMIKFIFDSILTINKKSSLNLLPCDYSQKLTELVFRYGLDKRWLIKGLREQLKQIEDVNLEQYKNEIKWLNKILLDCIKCFSNRDKKASLISECIMQTIDLIAYIPIGVNTTTLIREILG